MKLLPKKYDIHKCHLLGDICSSHIQFSSRNHSNNVNALIELVKAFKSLISACVCELAVSMFKREGFKIQYNTGDNKILTFSLLNILPKVQIVDGEISRTIFYLFFLRNEGKKIVLFDEAFSTESFEGHEYWIKL